MAYFNNAFNKVFVGIGNSNDALGFFNTAGVPSVDLANTTLHGPGSFGMFDPATWLSVSSASAAVTTGQPLVLAAASIYPKDKIGPFAGGYQESNKSKIINPRYVREFYRVDPCVPQADIVHIGNTNYTSTASPAPTGCCREFLCGETYYLRIDIKGSPALWFLDHNIYKTLDAYTGCCDATNPTPAPVDSTLVFITWANQIINDPILSQFLSPIVFDETGAAWYAPGNASALTPTWDNYVSPGHTTNACAGMRLQGSYVDTQFQDCSFQPSDFFQKEPIKILASEVDYTGDPCTFAGLCVVEECPPRQGQGFGEVVLRELILSESYLQNHFSTDVRIREVTQGTAMFIINRSTQYYRYYILHSVPRPYNPTGVFDNDQYLLEIIASAPIPLFETFMADWLDACGCSQVAMRTESCTTCTPTPIP
jgi:hypothetical protein